MQNRIGPNRVGPRGWFQPERIVEAFTDRQARLRLGELLGQGPDFDRATYTRL